MADVIYGKTIGDLLGEAASSAIDFARQNPFDAAALSTMTVPVIGDITGLLADANMYITQPEERNILNYGLTAASVLPMVPAASQAKNLVKAYHGSPYDFQKFDASNIGTGEGATMYGHGLYFTDSPEVAKFYKDVNTMAPYEYTIKGVPASEIYENAEKLENYEFMDLVESVLLHKTPKELKQIYTTEDGYSQALVDFVNDLDYDTLKGVDEFGDEMPLGRTYRVELDLIEDNLLDWQTAVSRQNPEIVRKVEELLGEDVGRMGGSAAYNRLVEKFGSPELASKALSDAGIKGIKYLDMTSGISMAEAPRNYVVFDDSLVNILEKYGVVATAGGGAIANSMRDRGKDDSEVIY